MLARKVLRVARRAEDSIRRFFSLNESPARIEHDAQHFWTRKIDSDNGLWWHARESSMFAGTDGQSRWAMIGRRHLGMWENFARAAGIERPVKTIVEWGCGGGANAVAFANECNDFWGVDVSKDAIEACKTELARSAPACVFHPVQIDVPSPEAALDVLPRNVDLFCCFYVFELLPSQEYGLRVLKIAQEVLRPGGVCFVQIKYYNELRRTRPRRWGYSRSAANMTTYSIDGFWEMAGSCGLEAKQLTLLPRPPEVPDERYAYYFLQKPDSK